MENRPLHIEQELCARIAEGDESALAEFFLSIEGNCSAYVFRLVRRQEAVREILQESLIRLWLYRDKLQEVNSLRAWFYRIVSNECSRYLQKHGFEQQVSHPFDESQMPPGSTPGINQTELDISFRETKRIIGEAVASLPTQRRIIFQMSREEGLTLVEIAQRLGVSRDYVKKAIMMALQSIRRKLQAAGKTIPLFLLLFY